MKKVTLFVKGVIISKNQFSLLCLVAICLQSCSTSVYQLTASADLSKQKFSGPSYPSSSSSKLDPGQNLGLLIILGDSYGESQGNDFGNPQGNNSSHLQGNNNFYASDDKGPGSFLNPGKNFAAQRSNNFTDNLFFKGGLEYIAKRSGDGGETTSLSYLQVPLYGIYQYQLKDAGRVFGGLGPYFAYGFGGSISDGKNSISAFGTDGGLKRFDAGLSLTAGYQIPHSFSFSLAYDMGLANIQSNGFGDKAHNIGFSLNVAYPLNRLINKIKGK